MATKRPASEMEASSPTASSSSKADCPPAKKTIFDPVQIGPVSSQEEMDIKVLKFQNKKLAERLDLRRSVEEELRERIQRLERRQANDEAVLCLLNRYWSQLDEDIEVLLRRFDEEAEEKDENTGEDDDATKEEKSDENLDVKEEMDTTSSNSESEESSKDKTKKENEAVVSFLALLSSSESDEIEQQLQQRSMFSKEAISKLIKVFDKLQQKHDKLAVSIQNSDDLDETIKATMSDVQSENKSLQSLVTSLQETHHLSSLKFAEQTDKHQAAETKTAELSNIVDNLQYDLDKARQRADKLESLLTDALSKLKMYKNADGGGGVSVSQGKLEEMNFQLNEQTEMASNRLAEIEKIQEKVQELTKENEKLKMDLQHIPEEVIQQTPEYKNLQSQFSVLFNEAMLMKSQLEDTRSLLQSLKNAHLRQIEQMESDELSCQKKLRTEVIQLEDTLAQVRKEYEMLRIEFEQTLATNEQAGPINREMRHVITSLQTHNQQLKSEAARYKKKLREAYAELHKLKSESGGSEKKDHGHEKEHAHVKKESGSHQSDDKKENRDKDKDKEQDKKEEKERHDKKAASDADIIKELKAQLKKSQESQKEMKLLLDMYKGCAKEQRDKVQLMAAEKKARGEVDDLKQRLRHMEEKERQESKKLADEDAIRKIRNLEEHIQELHKKLTATKQEEEALLSDMDVTGQAFEDMQEQNARLLQQLREKDDAYFKLMSERIKSNQIHKLLREEKDVLADQVATLQTQVEAQNQVVRKLEEKERILQNNVTTMEKELSLRQQALEVNKRKAVDASQTSTDSKKLVDRYQNQVNTLQSKVTEKASEVEQYGHKYRRCQEEIGSLRRKLERARRIELAGSADEILLEEVKTYKAQQTCPCCNVKRKDTVLTKCFHVFCAECIKTRYETRQRKCPECNAAFGANDYHRIYLG